MRTVRKHIIESRKDISDRFYIVPPVICKDGFKMSVQHSSLHCCSPRIDFAERQGYAEGSEFVSYEVGYPSEMEEILLPYAENPDCPTGTLYACVPAQIVEQVAEMHGGLAAAFPRRKGVLAVLCGAPGSGKTTVRKVLEDDYGFLSVSPDGIRKELFGYGSWLSDDDLVFEKVCSRLRHFLALGNVVLDGTNAKRMYRAKVLDETEGCRFVAVALVMDTPLDVCLENNLKRRRRLPKHVIERIHRELEEAPPSTNEGFDAVITYAPEYTHNTRKEIRRLVSGAMQAVFATLD